MRMILPSYRLMGRGALDAPAGGVPAWVTVAGGVPADIDLDFINDRAWLNAAEVSIASAVTFARSSDGLYTDSAGLVSSFASNALRRGSLGALFEGASTNLLTQSNFATGWTAQGATLTSASGTAPNGLNEAVLFQEDTANVVHRLLSANSPTFSAIAYAVSCYAKAGTHSLFQLSTALAIGGPYANYDLSAGTVTGFGGPTSASGIVPLGSGWYRCWLTFTATAGTGQIIPFLINSGTDGRGPQYTGSGRNILIWGMQCEAGALTSYIPTTAASASRAADSAYLTLPAGLQSLGAYSIWAKGTPSMLSSYAANQTMLSINQGASVTNRLQMYRGGNNPILALSTSAGAGTFAASIASVANTWTPGLEGRFGFGGDGTGQQAVFNGTLDGTVYSAAMPASIDRMTIGMRADGSQIFQGNIARAAMWGSRVTASNLGALA